MQFHDPPPTITSEQSLTDLEAEIARYQQSRATRFPAWLKQSYERDTHDARSRHIEFTMALGSVCFILTALTDFAFLPDIGFYGTLLRCIGIPLCAASVLVGPRLSPRNRERLVVVAGTLLVVILAIVPLLSSSPYAPVAFMSPIFALAFGNTTVVPRFTYARISTAICVVVISAAAIWQSPIGWAISLQVLLVAMFSLVANYRMERHERLEYLLGIHAAQRAAKLAADRELLHALSNTDALTRLANRRAFSRHCEVILTDHAHEGLPIAVMLADVDHFKAYNDHNGHQAGDECLRLVAQTIASATRSHRDIVARYGGEEFIALIVDIPPQQAHRLAERLCENIRALAIPHAGRDDGIAHVTISIGIATGVMSADTSVRSLTRAADEALYRAKNAGRNRSETAYLDAA